MPDITKLPRMLIMLVPLLLVLCFTKSDVGSPNDAARMATIQALGEHFTFNLDNSILKYDVDIQMRNGHRISDKPPMLQFLGAVLYRPLYLMGITFNHHYSWVYWILTFLLSGVPFIFLCYLINKWLVYCGCLSEKYVQWIVIWLGTLLLPWAVTFNNHVLTATLIASGLTLFLYDAKVEKVKDVQFLWSGFLLAFAITLELPTGGLSWFCGLLWLGVMNRRRLGYFLVGSLVPLLIHAALNMTQTGDLIPAYLHKEYYQFAGSYWGSPQAYQRLFGKNILTQYFHMLFGYRGLFLFCPVLILGGIEIIRAWRNRDVFWSIWGIIAVFTLTGTLTSYAIQISDFGGGSYGLRWVVALIPLWLLPSLCWFSRPHQKIYQSIAYGLVGLSIFFSMIGLYNPWPQNALTPSPILENISYMTFVPNSSMQGIAEGIIETTSLDKGLAYYELGRECWKREEFTEAVRYMDLALIHKPGDTQYLYQLGILLDMSSQFNRASEVFEALLKKEPDNVGAMNNYAAMKIKQGQYDEAIKLYEKALSYDPERFVSLTGLAQIYLKMNQPEKAAPLIHKAARLRPDDAQAQSLDVYLQNTVK